MRAISRKKKTETTFYYNSFKFNFLVIKFIKNDSQWAFNKILYHVHSLVIILGHVLNTFIEYSSHTFYY